MNTEHERRKQVVFTCKAKQERELLRTQTETNLANVKLDIAVKLVCYKRANLEM